MASMTSTTQWTSTLCPDVTVSVWSPHCHSSMHGTLRKRHFFITCGPNTDRHLLLLLLLCLMSFESIVSYLCSTLRVLLHRCHAVIQEAQSLSPEAQPTGGAAGGALSDDLDGHFLHCLLHRLGPDQRVEDKIDPEEEMKPDFPHSQVWKLQGRRSFVMFTPC